jgi:hypothetical protein
MLGMIRPAAHRAVIRQSGRAVKPRARLFLSYQTNITGIIRLNSKNLLSFYVVGFTNWHGAFP